jgi:hypothetical protein
MTSRPRCSISPEPPSHARPPPGGRNRVLPPGPSGPACISPVRDRSWRAPTGACQRGWSRPGRASPIARAGATAARCEARSSSPAVPSPCHSEHDASGTPRSATDTHGPLTWGRLIAGAWAARMVRLGSPLVGAASVTASPLSRGASTMPTPPSPTITHRPDLYDNLSLRRLSRSAAGHA